MTLVTAGRVGRPHGLDGSFHVEDVGHELPLGTELRVAGEPRLIERRAGTDDRPLVRLSGIADRNAATALRDELLLVEDELNEGEFVVADLVGCRVAGGGVVRRVVWGPSCELLELEDGSLIPFVSDAVRSIDLEAGTLELDRSFLGL